MAGDVARAVGIPVLADAGAGFGEPLHTMRTVREFIHAGVAGVHIEDQLFPKRAHYHKYVAHVIPRKGIRRQDPARLPPARPDRQGFRDHRPERFLPLRGARRSHRPGEPGGRARRRYGDDLPARPRRICSRRRSCRRSRWSTSSAAATATTVRSRPPPSSPIWATRWRSTHCSLYWSAFISTSVRSRSCGRPGDFTGLSPRNASRRVTTSRPSSASTSSTRSRKRLSKTERNGVNGSRSGRGQHWRHSPQFGSDGPYGVKSSPLNSSGSTRRSWVQGRSRQSSPEKLQPREGLPLSFAEIGKPRAHSCSAPPVTGPDSSCALSRRDHQSAGWQWGLTSASMTIAASTKSVALKCGGERHCLDRPRRSPRLRLVAKEGESAPASTNHSRQSAPVVQQIDRDQRSGTGFFRRAARFRRRSSTRGGPVRVTPRFAAHPIRAAREGLP